MKRNVPAPAIQHPKKTIDNKKGGTSAIHSTSRYKEGKDGGITNLLHKQAGVPIFLLSVLNANAEMIAPALPAAAEIPCANALNLVGNTSAG